MSSPCPGNGSSVPNSGSSRCQLPRRPCYSQPGARPGQPAPWSAEYQVCCCCISEPCGADCWARSCSIRRTCNRAVPCQHCRSQTDTSIITNYRYAEELMALPLIVRVYLSLGTFREAIKYIHTNRCSLCLLCVFIVIQSSSRSPRRWPAL